MRSAQVPCWSLATEEEAVGNLATDPASLAKEEDFAKEEELAEEEEMAKESLGNPSWSGTSGSGSSGSRTLLASEY